MDTFSFSVLSDWLVDFHAFSSQERDHHHLHHPSAPVTTGSDGNHASGSADGLGSVEGILLACVPLSKLLDADEARRALDSFVIDDQSDADEGMARGARVALADYAARSLSALFPFTWPQNLRIDNSAHADSSRGICNPVTLTINTMGQAKHSQAKINHRSSRRPTKMRAGKKEADIPFVLERTDCIVSSHKNTHAREGLLQFYLHVHAVIPRAHQKPTRTHYIDSIKTALIQATTQTFHRLKCILTSTECFAHIATVVLQRQLRGMLQPPRNFYSAGKICNDTTGDRRNHADTVQQNNNRIGNSYLNAVAFIADNSILPRKSGRSCHPMSSPPAIPFNSPQSDMLTREVQVDLGYWRRFLRKDGTLLGPDEHNDHGIMHSTEERRTDTTVSIRGMIIPVGVTLIVGGGYHGKSTLLQALSAGIYDKIPNDGRERCVTHADAVSIRAEDGRYVNRCNVAAFISNLPGNGLDTTRFSTMDASGSTSQAANVVEALESRASALLVDEDVSAANFMARDGRMRAMIMDEPITPLLYRVNGLFLSKEHHVSTVVVVGGVGEWLDVADAVVLMKDYVAYDGLKKARSVSYQFSYGHVQYAGRGVVHRLPWEVKEEKKPIADEAEETGNEKKQVSLSPLRRKPETACLMGKFHNVAVHLLDSGSSRLWFYTDEDASNSSLDDCDNDEDDGIVDMSKCSQLVGNASEQLYGCGICILWLLRESISHPDDDMLDLLKRLEAALDDGGMNRLLISLHQSLGKDGDSSTKDILPKILLSSVAHDLWEDVGFALRPRVHEVAMTLTRMRGLRFEILPEKPSQMDVPSEEEQEQKKKMAALAEMWNNRRRK